MVRTKKTEQKEELQKVPKNFDKELYWVLGVMIAIIAIFLLTINFAKKSNSFDYNGLTFEKEMVGNIPIYKHTYLTQKVMRTTAQVIRTNEAQGAVIYLRNDPRKLKNVHIEGNIEYLPLEYPVYIAIDSSPGLLCKYSMIAMHEISSFLTQNGYVVKAGISDEASAKEQNLEHITCEDFKDFMVISYVEGEKPSVTRNGNCYTLTISDCDILAPTEKFIVQSIIDAKQL